MPRKPHFVLAARRWGWPLSPSYGRVRGLTTRVSGWKPEGRRRLFAAPCSARQPARASSRGNARTLYRPERSWLNLLDLDSVDA
jgi:hypothetical protein